MRQADFKMTTGDRAPSLDYILENFDGSPVNLSAGATVTFVMRAAGASIHVVSGTAALVDGGTYGHVRYDWTANDAAALVPGRYYAQWQVTFPGAVAQTFPGGGDYLIIDVGSRL
jgi:hypothetical protein